MVKLKMVVVEIETPRWVKRTVAAAMAGALALGASAVVRADVTFSDYKPGDTLTAEGLNAKLNALKGAVNRITLNKGGVSYSLGGVPVGVTVKVSGKFPITNGKSGYAAAKQLCEQAFTPSAHMCSVDEIQRARQMGLSIPNADVWVSTSLRVSQPEGILSDCNAWSSNSAGELGIYYYGTNPNGPIMNVAACNAELPILCCD